MTLDQLSAAIGRGEEIATAELVPHLAAESRDVRLAVNAELAMAYLKRSDAASRAQAKIFTDRAWLLARHAPDLLSWVVNQYRALGDAEAVRDAYKRVGMDFAFRGDLARAIQAFTAMQYAVNNVTGRDRIEYDFDAIGVVDALLANQRFTSWPAGSRAGEPVRIAYLLKGLLEDDSNLMAILESFARYHDRARFAVQFWSIDTAADVARSPKGAEWLRRFRDLGYEVQLAEAGGATFVESTIALCQRLRASAPDVLLTSAGFADYRYYLVSALRPAPLVGGFIHGGSMALFAPPCQDFTIAWPRQCQIDAPVDATLVNLEVELSAIHTAEPLSRKALGLVGSGPLLLSAGRPQKLQEPAYWDAVAAILTAHPDASLLVVGATLAQLPAVAALPEPLRRRVHPLGWRTDYRRILRSVDVVLDTWPMGGGIVLMEAMAVGIPVVACRHDFLTRYDQTRSTGTEAFMDVPELQVAPGDPAAMVRVVARLLAEPSWRAEISARVARSFAERNGQPERMVRSCEQILWQRIRGHAARAA